VTSDTGMKDDGSSTHDDGRREGGVGGYQGFKAVRIHSLWRREDNQIRWCGGGSHQNFQKASLLTIDIPLYCKFAKFISSPYPFPIPH